MIALVVFVVLAVLRLRVFRPEDPASPKAREAAQVAHVVDGDTVDLVDGRRIRLLGIDAPEVAHGDEPGGPFGNESRQWLRDRIEGRAVTLRYESRRTDRYGRTLAWLFTESGELINQQALETGRAKLLADYGLPLDLEPALRQAEAQARVRELGVWKRSASSSKKAN
jgi:endonuclease YncB( thermonuclease family)